MELRLHCAQSIILYLEEKHKLDCSTTYIKQYVNERDAVFAKYFPNISNKTNAKSLINTATMMEDMKVGKILFLKNYLKEIKEFYEAIIEGDFEEYKDIKQTSDTSSSKKAAKKDASNFPTSILSQSRGRRVWRLSTSQVSRGFLRIAATLAREGLGPIF